MDLPGRPLNAPPTGLAARGLVRIRGIGRGSFGIVLGARFFMKKLRIWTFWGVFF
jgi:hypothetical protein